MATEIQFELAGCVNNVPVQAQGRPNHDSSTGRFEAELETASPPLHWDPALALLGLLDFTLVTLATNGAGFDKALLRRRVDRKRPEPRATPLRRR